MANINKRTSPYRKTPIRDFYMDYWVPISISAQESDIEVTIGPEHHLRPDLLAYQLYASPNLFWVFALRNQDVIIDPINDFIAGTKIFVPTPDTVESIIP